MTNLDLPLDQIWNIYNNPCEQLWDIIKDAIGKRLFATIGELRKASLPALRRFWLDPACLVGRDWLLAQANATNKSLASF